VAKEQKITDEEIGAIQGIVMAVAAGKINVMMRDIPSPSQD
jgi:hypothetical protein